MKPMFSAMAAVSLLCDILGLIIHDWREGAGFSRLKYRHGIAVVGIHQQQTPTKGGSDEGTGRTADSRRVVGGRCTPSVARLAASFPEVNAMRVAIVHYHLHPGGVTRVIQHAVHALRAHGARTVVLTGEAPSSVVHGIGEVRVVPGLGYDHTAAGPGIGARDLALELRRAAARVLGGAPSLWHVHNHALGKNLSLPASLRLLAEQGGRLLLHLHDFVEDGRPANYRRLLEGLAEGDPGRLSALLYPLAGQVHYGVINGRDRGFLASAQVPAASLHALPNAVWLPEAESPADLSRPPGGDVERRLWLYPTRAIRRKNLGELLLWAALARDGDRFATTQGPRNPRERPVYEAWLALAQELRLPFDAELGAKPGVDFSSLLRSAHALVTTSVAEGFGLAFLEPWLVGRPVAGRNLPEITDDFAVQGIDLGPLYTRVRVPLDWLDRVDLERRIRAGLERVLSAYGRSPGGQDVQRVLRGWAPDGTGLDFGRLDETLQERIIRHLAASPADAAELDPPALPDPRPGHDRLQANRRVVERVYGLEGYGERLMQVYGAVLETPVEPLGAADGQALLDRFLEPERLNLLRS
jgi:glycosyltransferase involved in cell wall biosynthesis